jgi:hypothetical protein
MQRNAYVSARMTIPLFVLYGWTWFYLSATFGIFTTTNYVLSVMMRMFRPWRERGFGLRLICSLWAAT